MFMAIVVGCLLADNTNCNIYSFEDRLSDTQEECDDILYQLVISFPFDGAVVVDAMCVHIEGLSHLVGEPA